MTQLLKCLAEFDPSTNINKLDIIVWVCNLFTVGVEAGVCVCECV